MTDEFEKPMTTAQLVEALTVAALCYSLSRSKPGRSNTSRSNEIAGTFADTVRFDGPIFGAVFIGECLLFKQMTSLHYKCSETPIIRNSLEPRIAISPLKAAVLSSGEFW